MSTRRWDKHFFATTRGRIVALLRQQARTVDELARSLGLTDNAVRAHLTTLERDGLVERAGLRPGPSKPSYDYDLTAETEHLFSRAYPPVLDALLAELLDRDGIEAVEALLQSTGKRLAQAHPPAGDTKKRLAQGTMVLNELGGLAETETNGDQVCIRGYSCPLASITGKHPAVCLGIATLLSEVVGIPMREACDRSGRPRCCFYGMLEPESMDQTG